MLVEGKGCSDFGLSPLPAAVSHTAFERQSTPRNREEKFLEISKPWGKKIFTPPPPVFPEKKKHREILGKIEIYAIVVFTTQTYFTVLVA